MFGEVKMVKHRTIVRTLVGQRRISADYRQLFCTRRQCKRLIVVNYEHVVLHPSVRLRTHRHVARRTSERAPFKDLIRGLHDLDCLLGLPLAVANFPHVYDCWYRLSSISLSPNPVPERSIFRYSHSSAGGDRFARQAKRVGRRRVNIFRVVHEDGFAGCKRFSLIRDNSPRHDFANASMPCN